MDPGVRSFLTFFSEADCGSEADCEADCGTVGYQAFGRIQRLCQHLDRLISRTDQEKNRKKRRNLRKAQARMRQKLINLVDELHWQCARWLTSNYRVILLPKFETQSMTRRGERQIQSKTARKTARMMLSFQHYRFKKRLQWKAWQRGSLVLEVNEAYTSRTRSWDGRVDEKLGGSRTIRDESGFIMDRDINGARGIFLRALGDSPFLRELLTRVASQQTSTLLILVSDKLSGLHTQPRCQLHPLRSTQCNSASYIHGSRMIMHLSEIEETAGRKTRPAKCQCLFVPFENPLNKSAARWHSKTGLGDV